VATIVDAVEAVSEWLEREVCPRLWLKAPQQKEPGEPEMVHPLVHRMYVPTDKMLAAGDSVHPSITVSVSATVRPLTAETELAIRLLVVTWSPGPHPNDADPPSPGRPRPSADGWADCYGVADVVTAALRRGHVIGGSVAVDVGAGIKVDPYQEDGAIVDLWPYYCCSLSMAAHVATPPLSDIDSFL